MATYADPITVSMSADTDLSSYQYHVMMAASTGGYVQLLTASTTVAPIGILMNDPDASGEAALVAILGEAKVMADSAIVAGNWLHSTATGHAVAATVGTHITFGIALEALASGSGIIRCLLLGINVPA